MVGVVGVVVSFLFAYYGIPALIDFCYYAVPRSIKFFIWLKGSQVIYFLDISGCVRSCSSYSLSYVLSSIKSGDSVIAIRHGFWRRRSAIYGLAVGNWQLARARVLNEDTGVLLEFRDKYGVKLEDGLRLINSHNSLQAMFDRIAEQDKNLVNANARIAELEKELKHANERRQEWYSGVKAILEIVNRERQTYRSTAAGRIRNRLEAMTRSTYLYEEPLPPEDKIQRWLRIF